MLCAIPYATLELKIRVLDLLKNNRLEIYKKIHQGPRITRLAVEAINDMGVMPFSGLLKIHEDIFMQEVSLKEKRLDVQNIREILQVFHDIRKDDAIKAYMKGLLARVEVSKFENREEIKDVITKEYLEQ